MKFGNITNDVWEVSLWLTAAINLWMCLVAAHSQHLEPQANEYAFMWTF